MSVSLRCCTDILYGKKAAQRYITDTVVKSYRIGILTLITDKGVCISLYFMAT